MFFWIIVGVIVLGLFALCFAGTDRYRFHQGADVEAVRQRTQGIRTDTQQPE
ncbi:hypothetical protein HNR19_002991 [Nocardioides thalensis]|uniref:Uncharacterized protein n=1 Tax=Nocardioides thalensis TaxID=1914755 RepID=A0A853C7T9_9ACTN|nr:hypothetical protein [Nocardioides thalensis]NYJ02293.1 hypothetical protein [Nocardioides thalensis]